MAYRHHNTSQRRFSHLTPIQRGQIKALRDQGRTLQEIADEIGFHKATISRELKRRTVTQKKSDLLNIKRISRKQDRLAIRNIAWQTSLSCPPLHIKPLRLHRLKVR